LSAAARLAALLVLPLVSPEATSGQRPAKPLVIAVMDPLTRELGCDCVAGYGQRRYGELAAFLKKRLGREAKAVFAEALSLPWVPRKELDLVIGSFAEVRADARRLGLRLRPIAMLTGLDGQATTRGLFVVRADDPARNIEDLAGRKVLFGPAESPERSDAARRMLEAFGLPIQAKPPVAATSASAAVAVIEREADAAVISAHQLPLLIGCHTIEKGELRVVHETDPVPFIAVFGSERVSQEAQGEIVEALRAVGRDKRLLAALESREGFVPLPDPFAPGVGKRWPDWRGPYRDGISPDVPEALPTAPRLLWSRTLTGPGMSGLAVAERRVVVANKDLDDERDIFHCLDADTGEELWRLSYRAKGEMDFTNSPRANPVICGRLVYLLGAFGDLHCVELASGRVVWRRNILADFGAELPSWGTCPTPLVVGEKLIVSPGAARAAVVALDRFTGKVLWVCPGVQPGYGSFIVATLGGRRQIVGYDCASLGGWDPATGRRLWQLIPPVEGDYNVPTPIAVDGRLLVSTENNGTRLYAFDRRGLIESMPLAENRDLKPDTATPVVVNGLVFGSSGELLCLDLANGLKTLWKNDSERFTHHCTLIGGNGKVLVVTQSGHLYLIEATGEGYRERGSLALFEDVPSTERDVWSHPALVGNRLYVRNLLGIYCFILSQ